jgi:hypothetical protein
MRRILTVCSILFLFGVLLVAPPTNAGRCIKRCSGGGTAGTIVGGNISGVSGTLEVADDVNRRKIVVRGAQIQTTPLVDFRQYDGTVVFEVDNDGVVTTGASADPMITLTDSTHSSDGFIALDSVSAADAVLTLGVDDSNGDDEVYIEIDGENDRIELTHDVLLKPASTTTNFATTLASGSNNEFVGLPRIGVTTAAWQDNSALAFLISDDSPEGECAPLSGTGAAEATVIRVGSGSYKYTFDSSVGSGEGIDCVVSGHAANGSDSIGFWWRSSVTYDAADLEAVLDDGASEEAAVDLPAYATANEWVWIELDLAAQCDADCADIDSVFIRTYGCRSGLA